MRYSLVLNTFVAVLAMASASFGAPLYVEDFDTDHTANWTTNNNGAGTNAANYFFDYSTVGIPSAPHSSGGTRIGLKLQANISGTGPASGNLPGISVSPSGQSFTGNYTIKFDWWHNFIGGTTGGIGNAAGGSGSTQLSEFGLLTSGTTSNFVGVSDGLFFSADGDGASSADYRVYSSEKPASYQVGDAHNVYAAGSRDSANAYYQTLFPAGNSAGSSIQQTTYASTQTGSTVAGVAGFKWHDVVIQKTGTTVTWTVDGTLLATVTNIDQFTTATSGNNILFGHGDTSLGAGTPAATFAAVDFTLIDNVKVVPEPSTLALCGIAMLGLVGWLRRR